MLANRSMPTSTVIPVLVYPDVGEAIDWLCAVFGFTERWRAGGHRGQVAVAPGGAVVVGQGTPIAGPEIMVRVEDADAHHAHAAAGGATIVAPPQDYPYGERQYGALDLAGYRWTFSESIADSAPEDWGGVTAPGAGRPRR